MRCGSGVVCRRGLLYIDGTSDEVLLIIIIIYMYIFLSPLKTYYIGDVCTLPLLSLSLSLSLCVYVCVPPFFRWAYERDHEGDFRNISIPSRFESFEDYLAVWTPLAIRELRAHFMNKCLTEPPDVSIPVRVSVSRRSNAVSSSLVTLDVDIIGQPGAGNIMGGNEILIMTKHGKALTVLRELEQKLYAQQGTGVKAPHHRKKKKFVPDPLLRSVISLYNCMCTPCVIPMPLVPPPPF